MNRRSFLGACLTPLGLGTAAFKGLQGPSASAHVMTVTGPIDPQQMGVTLPHEHVLVDFIGADQVSADRYDRDEVVRVAWPHAEQLRRLGGRTLVECTPAYLARDPLVLRTLSEATGLYLLTNTGYYGAREDQHLPPHAFSEPADALAARWVQEWREGIDGTGIRPGFIKIGVDPGSLSEIDRKLVQAAARTHRQTGLTIAAHTGAAPAAFEELEVLGAEGIDPSAWIWVHAQGETDLTRHVEAARQGAWVEFDGFRPDQTGRYLELITNMRQHGLLHRVLVSQDAGWYHVGEPGGGTFRPYAPLLTDLLPALGDARFTPEELHQLVVRNPAEAFSVRVRTR